MKALMLIAVVGAWSTLSWGQSFDALKFCEEEKLTINLCDRLEWGNIHASAENVSNCRERPSANTGESKCSEAVAQERAALRIREGKVVRQKFNAAELTDAGFGLPILAERVYFYSNGSEKERELLTKPDHLCQYLGFDKASEAIVDNTLFNGDKMRNKSMVVHDLNKWYQAGKKISINNYDYDLEKEDFNMVKSYQEITCVRVADEADKQLIKDVEAKLVYLGAEVDGGRELALDKSVNDSDRGEELLEYDSSLAPFLHVPSRSQGVEK